jgi:AcrR family transcriptional regulator
VRGNFYRLYSCRLCTKYVTIGVVQEAVSLRERKKHETRHAISSAALELALAQGPANVTVEDIAAAAQVSARTVFNYFPNKDAAILGIDPSRRRELVEHLLARPPDEEPLQAVQAPFLAVFTPEMVTRWRTRARLVRAHPPLRSAYLESWSGLEEELVAALAQRTGIDPSADLYPRLVVGVTVAALRVAVGAALDAGRSESVADAVHSAFATIAAGLPAPPPSDAS